MSDLTVFILTCGEESLKQCMETLERQGLEDGTNIELINDVYPMSEAFNEMHRRCKTPYFIQVDADVILNDGAIDALYQNLKRSNFFIYATYGQLYEEGFGLGGSVRCWKRDIFKIFKFRDVRTVDRDFYRRARYLGFKRKDVGGVLGIHRPRHSNFSDYLKTKGDVEKWQFLNRPFKKYAEPLYEELIKDTHKNRYRILGFFLGTLSSKERVCKSKDVYTEKETLRSILSLLKADFDKFALRDGIDFLRLKSLLKEAYRNYSPITKKGFLKETFKELFGIDLDASWIYSSI